MFQHLNERFSLLCIRFIKNAPIKPELKYRTPSKFLLLLLFRIEIKTLGIMKNCYITKEEAIMCIIKSPFLKIYFN